MGLWGKIKKQRKRIDRSLNKRRTGHACNVCQQTFHHFYPFEGGSKAQPEIARSLSIIGSDVDHFSCPHCGAHDRERHLFMYFDALDLWAATKGRVLHFAPEKHLRKAIAAQSPAQYICGDLFPTRDDIIRLDVTAIPYEQDSFDLIICNHILEHVPNVDLALSELHRVLKPGGKGCCKHLTRPYCSRPLKIRASTLTNCEQRSMGNKTM